MYTVTCSEGKHVWRYSSALMYTVTCSEGEHVWRYSSALMDFLNSSRTIWNLFKLLLRFEILDILPLFLRSRIIVVNNLKILIFYIIVSQSFPIKIWGKSVKGYLSYDCTYKQIDQNADNFYIFRFMYFF